MQRGAGTTEQGCPCPGTTLPHAPHSVVRTPHSWRDPQDPPRWSLTREALRYMETGRPVDIPPLHSGKSSLRGWSGVELGSCRPVESHSRLVASIGSGFESGSTTSDYVSRGTLCTRASCRPCSTTCPPGSLASSALRTSSTGTFARASLLGPLGASHRLCLGSVWLRSGRLLSGYRVRVSRGTSCVWCRVSSRPCSCLRVQCSEHLSPSRYLSSPDPSTPFPCPRRYLPCPSSGAKFDHIWHVSCYACARARSLFR